MAGRGRAATLPAWMKKQQEEQGQQQQQQPAGAVGGNNQYQQQQPPQQQQQQQQQQHQQQYQQPPQQQQQPQAPGQYANAQGSVSGGLQQQQQQQQQQQHHEPQHQQQPHYQQQQQQQPAATPDVNPANSQPPMDSRDGGRERSRYGGEHDQQQRRGGSRSRRSRSRGSRRRGGGGSVLEGRPRRRLFDIQPTPEEAMLVANNPTPKGKLPGTGPGVNGTFPPQQLQPQSHHGGHGGASAAAGGHHYQQHQPRDPGAAAAAALTAGALAQRYSGAGAGTGAGGAGGMDPKSYNNFQQTRHARRLYVGGVEHADDEALKEFFQTTINRGLHREENGVISVYVNTERRFAFVELTSIELTTACLVMDGLVYRGQQFKIRRPNDFAPERVGPLGEIPRLDMTGVEIGTQSAAEVRGGGSGGGHGGGVSSMVPEGPNKVFIGGLPHHLPDSEVKELLESFGPLRSLHVVRDPGAPTCKGYGFCEYADPNKTEEAVNGLNGLVVADRTLTVRRAIPRGMSTATPKSMTGAPQMGGGGGAMMAANWAFQHQAGGATGAPADASLLTGADLLKMTQAAGMQAAMQPLGVPMGMPGMPPGMPPAPVGPPPTRILVLLNMVMADELSDDSEYTDIVEDIQMECAKFGTVVSLVVPRPGAPGGGVGKVFIEYQRAEDAERARQSLQGRKFGDRFVGASFMEEAKFQSKQLDE